MQEETIELGERLVSIIGLETCPVGVYLLGPDDSREPFGDFTPLARHRYCQAVMRARRGDKVLLSPDACACPAARSAFGFKDLPEGLFTGKGLVGFGIVREAATGRTLFEHMPRLDPGQVREIALAPLSEAPAVPDVVVIEGPPEHLMWILLADINRAGGERRHTNTAVLQAVCVDSTVVPYKEQRVSFTLGCYGCREATDIGADEASLGFPGALLAPLVDHLGALTGKAMPRSRAKGAFKSLMGRGEGAPDEAPPASHPDAWSEEAARRAEAQQRAEERDRLDALAGATGTAEPPAAGRHGATAPAPEDRPKSWRADLGALPRLERDLVLRLEPGEVMQVFRATLDGDANLAMDFVAGALHRKIRKILERPHCAPAFELYRIRSE